MFVNIHVYVSAVISLYVHCLRIQLVYIWLIETLLAAGSLSVQHDAGSPSVSYNGNSAVIQADIELSSGASATCTLHRGNQEIVSKDCKCLLWTVIQPNMIIYTQVHLCVELCSSAFQCCRFLRYLHSHSQRGRDL